MRGEPHVDRQHPQLAQHLQDALLGGDRQREHREVDAGLARIGDEFVDIAELGETLDGLGRARVAAVVEHAEQLDLGGVGLGEIADQLAGEIAAADHHDALLEPPRHREPVDDDGEREARDRQRVEADQEPGAEPEARDDAVELGEEHHRDQRREDEGPGAADPEQLVDRPPQRRHAVALQHVEGDDVDERQSQRQQEIDRLRADLPHHMGLVERQADAGDNDEIERLRGAEQQDAGMAVRRRRVLGRRCGSAAARGCSWSAESSAMSRLVDELRAGPGAPPRRPSRSRRASASR